VSRVSLSRRLQALFETADKIDPQATAVHRMKPATRLRFDHWRACCDRITDELGGGETLYQAYVETGEWPLPEPPRAVAEALGMDDGPVLLETMDVRELAEIYAAMIAD